MRFVLNQLLFLTLVVISLGLGVISCGGKSSPPPAITKFSAGIFSNLKPYIDSVFISKDGNRIYFLHSIYAPRVMNGTASAVACAATVGTLLPGHVTAPNLEWNTDLYYVEWSGSSWSAPVNLGTQINTYGNECCVWLNDAETEIIFYRGTDLDGDGIGGDLGLPPSGNYRSTRADKNSAWSQAIALDGVYGTTNQTKTIYRHDIHKTPSNNYYLWEKNTGVNGQLLFGQWNGTSYDAPIVISGSGFDDTQIWAADDEKTIVFNRRPGGGANTDLYKMTRPNTLVPFGAPTQIVTTGFEDSVGGRVWGEPTFDASLSFMLYVRFNTADTNCWSADMMYAPGNVNDGFSSPIILTR